MADTNPSGRAGEGPYRRQGGGEAIFGSSRGRERLVHQSPSGQPTSDDGLFLNPRQVPPLPPEPLTNPRQAPQPPASMPRADSPTSVYSDQGPESPTSVYSDQGPEAPTSEYSQDRDGYRPSSSLYAADGAGYSPMSSSVSSWDEAQGRLAPAEYLSAGQVPESAPGLRAVENRGEVPERSVFDLDYSDEEQGLKGRLTHSINRAGHSLASKVKNNLPHLNRGGRAHEQPERQRGTGGAGGARQVVPGAGKFPYQQPNASSTLIRKPRGKR